jgi:methyltransferase FkbM-like protein
MTYRFGSLRRPVADVLDRARFVKGERSYSQEGEDRILDRLFGPVAKGFYVDVGAHHPIRFSNTFLFYRRGWRGVNIDAMPGSMRLFEKYRSRDTNIEAGIGLETATIPFYVFNEPALNSFDRELSEVRDTGPYRIEKIIDVRVSPLNEVLRGRLPRENVPSFLTVDVEGRDLEALISNDWSAFRPTYVLAESVGTTIEEAMQGPMSTFMSSVGYEAIAKTANTVFYQAAD